MPKSTEDILAISRTHLAANDLKPEDAAVLPEINFDMPPLQGRNIREHFQVIGKQIAEPYLGMSQKFASVDLPPIPKVFETTKSGWTRYYPDGRMEQVENLDGESLICFDVEVLYKLSPFACMATAATPNAWYSWLSPAIFADPPDQLIADATVKSVDPKELRPDVASTLIPMFSKGSTAPAIVVGHNVGYDRARVLDEYSLEKTPIRWADTLSLHCATKGITSVQRPAWMKRRKEMLEKQTNNREAMKMLQQMEDDELPSLDPELDDIDDNASRAKSRWEDVTSSNSLAEVARLHLGLSVDKSVRSVFGLDHIKSASQLKPQLQELLVYCAKDTETTQKVLGKVLPIFLENCPHPATYAGALGMGNPFLPIDRHWKEYLRKADETFRQLEGGVKGVLWDLAYRLKSKGCTEGDPWATQLDWSPKPARWPDAAMIHAANADQAKEFEEADRKHAETSQMEESIRLLDAMEANEPAVEEHDSPQVAASSTAEVNVTSSQSSPTETYILPETVPSWLADDAQKWLIRQPTGASIGDVLPLVLRVSFEGKPLVESQEYRWVVQVPKAESVDFAAKGYHGPLEFKDRADEYLVENDFDYFRPCKQAAPKVTSPFTKRLSKEWKSGLYSSLYPEIPLGLVKTGKREDYHFQISQALKDFIKDGQKTVWGQRLDWNPNPYEDCPFRFPTSNDVNAKDEASAASQTSPPIKASKQPKRTIGAFGIWPRWFWDLTSSQMSQGELDLTVRKKIAPILLRMQWDGFPLFSSREHGWLYRVPKDLKCNVNLEKAVRFEIDHKQDDAIRHEKDYYFFKVPHHAGDKANVGNPLAKSFLPLIENGVLSSAPSQIGDDPEQGAQEAMNMNAQCSYWISARDRIRDQMAIYNDGDKGLILPQVITMGTVTRRAVEATWLTASNAKKNRVGSELKAMVRAPEGYKFVGADVDSEELWIASVMGDSQFGMHGGTAIGWMTLEGTKSAGTDVHSKTAKILNTSRNNAKIFNYSRIYGAGTKHAVQLLLQHDPKLTKERATTLAKDLYLKTKGNKTMTRLLPKGRKMVHLWHGGSESYLFNTLEKIAGKSRPTTPALGAGVTDALKRGFLPEDGVFGSDYLPSRINWVVQSSGVDYLHLLIVAMEWLIQRYDIKARYMISVHDELRYMVKDEDTHRAALALQVANAWVRALFSYNLGMDELPQSIAFFSAVDVDHVLRKEVDMSCVTPSQPTPIPAGECFDIEEILKLTNGDLGPVVVDNGTMGIEMRDAKIPVAEAPNIKSPNHLLYLNAQAAANRDVTPVFKYFNAALPQIRKEMYGDSGGVGR